MSWVGAEIFYKVPIFPIGFSHTGERISLSLVTDFSRVLDEYERDVEGLGFPNSNELENESYLQSG